MYLIQPHAVMEAEKLSGSFLGGQTWVHEPLRFSLAVDPQGLKSVAAQWFLKWHPQPIAQFQRIWLVN